jgi:hypothetical protein
MIKKISLIAILFSIFNTGFSQSDTTAPKYSITTSGSIDAYFRNSFSTPSGETNNLTSFTNTNKKLALGMASLKVDQSLGKFAATVDLGLGKRAEEFSYNDNGFLAYLKQAYFSYSLTDQLKITTGKWATHVGYELLDAYSNRNYSMSYGFSYGPFFHTGVRADVSLGGKSAMMIGVAEPTDFINAKVEPKILIAQFSTATKDDKLKAYLNYQGGKDKTQFDLVLNGIVSSKFGVNYDGTICSLSGTSWSSNALYFNYDPNAKVGVTLRSEYFNDSKSALGLGTSIFQNTLSVNIHFNKFTIIPELRFDNAADQIFLTKAQAATGTAGNFLIAAVYKF